jgi:hypothetical protein
MVQTRQTYDADLHTRHKQQHGSWVLTLMKSTTKAAQ